jgi:hypothetical protein
MRRLITCVSYLLVVAFVVACWASAKPKVQVSSWSGSYASLLQRYVTPEGVRYTAWKASPEDMQALRTIATQLAETALPEDSKSRLAFYIDAYNVTVLHQVLQVFPISGVLEHDPDFFKQTIYISGQKMTLDHLENEVIRKEFKEPRIHFALNCASISCPPLLPKPYYGSNLDVELEKQTHAYLNSWQGYEEMGGKVLVSQLFEWFTPDFEAAEGSITSFIAKHRLRPLPDTELTFRAYNWNLNLAP